MGPTKLYRTSLVKTLFTNAIDGTKGPNIKSTFHQSFCLALSIAFTCPFQNCLGKTLPSQQLVVCCSLLATENKMFFIISAIRIAGQHVIPHISLYAHIGKGNSSVILAKYASGIAVVQRVSIWDTVLDTLYKQNFRTFCCRHINSSLPLNFYDSTCSRPRKRP